MAVKVTNTSASSGIRTVQRHPEGPVDRGLELYRQAPRELREALS